MNKEITSSIRFERVHIIQKTNMSSTETARDVIAPIKFNETETFIFTDLSQETLTRRRALKPLVNQLQAKNISYRWGFPACLVAKNQGVSATLQFPEDLKEFCSKLDLPCINIENWEKRTHEWGKLSDRQWKKV